MITLSSAQLSERQEAVEHLIPEVDGPRAGKWREGTAEEAKQYDVERECYRVRVEIDDDDPLTVALLFRELRAAARMPDIKDVRVTLTVDFSSVQRHEIEALKQFSELTWVSVVVHRPKLTRTYYRKKWRP